MVDRILADLDNYGLTSDPDFRKVSLDTVISLNGPADEEAPAPDLPAEGLTGTLNQDSTELDVGLALGNLPSASAGITAVKPTDSIEKAMTEMRLNDFSQLPVMTTTREIKGSVTWRSIAKALAHSSDASLDDALEAAPVHSYEQDLVDVLGVLCDHDFIFVRDSKREISGIVTTADVVRLYGETATPFFLIGEIDHLLRGAISDTWTIEQVTAVCNPENERSLLSHDDLSFGDYQRMLENPERFEAMGWPLDRATFINRLDEVRRSAMVSRTSIRIRWTRNRLTGSRTSSR
ncbi:MAG: CBS domain-containing protein [Acidimicrobiia bacterium]|nr:CBS domain-containing protein [Acidimicrobiia bacterium]